MRSYAKESKKSNPVGIRYNLSEFETAKTKSGKKTAQALFDFLLTQYVQIKVEPAPLVYDSQKLPNTFIKDEPKQWQEPKIDQFQAYAQEIKKAGSFYELGVVMHEVDKDKLLSRQDKMKLEQLGHQIRKDLNF